MAGLPLSELRALFPVEDLWSEPERLAPYSRDESDQGIHPPEVVVFARSTEQVSRLLALCQATRTPVTPCGARTGKSGGSLTLRGGVALSLERMDRIVRVSREDLTATAQPGVLLGRLMEAVEAEGLFYPPDPNSWESCTLGGNVAENAGGPRALKYGVTRDWVLGMEWVVPTGEVHRVGRPTIKGVAGYDLAGLFIGSEGTLGVCTELTVQLIPKPAAVVTALLAFPSLRAGAEAISAVLGAGHLPRTLELLDPVAIRAVEQAGLFRYPSGAQSVVLVELDGADGEALMAELARLGEVATKGGASEVLVSQNESQRRELWRARSQVSPSLRKLARFKFSEDVVVPRSRIVEMVERTHAMGVRRGLTVATYGHAGDGNLHANVLWNEPSERPNVDGAIEEIVRTAVELGGTITGEHGVGLSKREFLSFEQSPALIELQRRMQAFFDPAGVMNPGKMFPAR